MCILLLKGGRNIPCLTEGAKNIQRGGRCPEFGGRDSSCSSKLRRGDHYKHVAISIATMTRVNSLPERVRRVIIAYSDILKIQ